MRPREASSPLDFDQEVARVPTEDGTHKRFARDGVRTFYDASSGNGTADTVRFGDDALLTVVNCVRRIAVRWRYDSHEPLILLRASLSCDVAFQLVGAPPLIFNRPEVTLACVPAGRLRAVDIVGGARQQGLIGVFRGANFAQRFGLEPEDLPPVVRDALSGSGAVGRIASFPLDHRIASVIGDTIDTRLDGELRVVQYAGRLAELVAYTLDAMQHSPSLRGNALHRRRDLELAHAALARLDRDYRQPPLFADLAHQIGTNQNKLKALFKEAFGVTMAQYCLERRMREAQQLLLEATLTIAQVAERVGYEHQSSFTAAFRGYVGMAPREYRQHRAPFSLTLDPVRAPRAIP